MHNYKYTSAKGNKKPVYIEGFRSAFVKSFSLFEDCDTLELLSRVSDGLLRRVPIDPAQIDAMIAGTVIPQTKNANIARDTILNLGLPSHIYGYTLNSTCLSGLQCVINGVQTISSGKPHFILAGGVECLSDVPVVYSREARKFLVKLSKAKSAAAKLNIIKHFRAKAWFPKAPELCEPLTGMSMGEHAEIMAQKNSIGRKEQDQYTLLSHQKAMSALERGFFKDEILPIWAPPNYEQCIDQDFIGQANITNASLTALKVAFDKRYGTITSGNSSPLTDGASLCLIGDEKRARDHGLSPKLRILDYDIVAVDLHEQLLIGPALTIPRLLSRNKLTLKDIDRFEIHEAFAAQILSCLQAMESSEFFEKYFGKSKALGEISLDKLNVNGGALALGHPFGASGARLLTTLANELKSKDLQFGVLSMCAAGGMAASVLVERIN